MTNSISKLRHSAGALSKKLGYKEDKQNITWLEWTMLGLILAFCFVSFHYVDMDSILDNTVLFVRSVTEGKFFDFYAYSIDHAVTNWSANYELPVYILFAIWNLPTIILGYFMPVTYTENIVCILWAKLMIVVFMVLCAYMIYKLAKLAGLERRRSIFAAFLFSSSSMLIVFTNVLSQMEIVPLFFMLLGIYYFIKDKMPAFVICFAIAIPLKMFALFVFVPLVLLKVKNVFKVALYGIGGMSIQLICKLIFINSEEYHYATSSNTSSIVARLVKGNIICANAEIPMFLFVLIGVCIIAYILKPDNINDIIKLSFYMPFVIFSAMFIFFSANTYWIVLLVPFMTMAIMLNPERLKVNLFLEMAAGAAYAFYCFCYSTAFAIAFENFDQMLLNKLFPVADGMKKQYTSMKDFMSSTGLIKLENIFFCLFVVCIVALLVINYPKKGKPIGNREKIEYSVIWARFAVLMVLVATVTFSYMKTVNEPIIDTSKEAVATTEFSIANEDNTLVQPFSVSEDFEASRISLKFDNGASNRRNMGNITFTLTDEKGNVLAKQTEGTSLIPAKSEFTLKIKNITLKADETYLLKMTGEKNNNNGQTKLMVTEGVSDKLPPASLNGEKQNYSIYMKVS